MKDFLRGEHPRFTPHLSPEQKGEKEFRPKKGAGFIYQSFNLKRAGHDLKFSFQFKIEPDIYFRPEIIIKNVSKKRISSFSQSVLNNLAFHLGLVEILSYWKATCSPEIIIQAGYLNQEQVGWWQDLIFNGMGEFFYTNKIDFTQPDFLKIKIQGKEKYKRYEGKSKKRILVPIGGGKDSIVTLEILKTSGQPLNCLAVNPSAISLIKVIPRVIQMAGYQNPIIIERHLDKHLLELNEKGYFNGHIPFSANLAFLAVAGAVIFDYNQIAFSHEQSANQGNLTYLGQEINHQYSRTFRFEKRFHSYAKKYLAKNVDCFSFLRPLYEIQIAGLFSKFPQYFKFFRSCNRGQKTDVWCGQCPKCLSVFSMLYPFCQESDLLTIFGENLFAKKSLLPVFQALIGEKGHKPFECVGTKEENLIASYLSWQKANPVRKAGLSNRAKKEKNLPFLLEYFERRILPKYSHLQERAEKIMNSWNSQHYLPKNLEGILKKCQGSPRAALLREGCPRAALIANKKILILGLGKEGQDSFLFFRRLFPQKILGLADRLEMPELEPKLKKLILADKPSPTFVPKVGLGKKNRLHLGKNYLQSLKKYDYIIKSPGIRPDLPELLQVKKRGGKITSQTEIFFDAWPGKIIGVTGTKGKGTTTSLIYQVLKAGGIKAHLIGNIGRPSLSFLKRENRTRNEVFVYELSSYQLADLKKSPAIAVFLNIFSEHLDYHRNFNQYLKAKENITRYQTKEDYLIFNSSYPALQKIAKQSRAKKIPFDIKKARKEKIIPNNRLLKGEFNLQNIMPAVIIGKIFGVPAEIIKKVIKNFQGLKHRLEFVGQYQGIKFYNDSLATVSEATMAALGALGGNVATIILGGFDRGFNFRQLGQRILRKQIKTLILFPVTGQRIWQAITSQAKRPKTLPRHFLANNMKEAVKLAYQYTQKGKICLLSPASPSFGLFRNYQERGNLFKKYVRLFGSKAPKSD